MISDTTVVILIEVAMGLILICMFAPGRKLLATAMGILMKVFTSLSHVLLNLLQAAGVYVWRCHLVVFRNLRPRVTVLPTIAKKSTRRD